MSNDNEWLIGKLYDQIDRQNTKLEILIQQLEEFKPKGELGPLHGAGMAFAYQDVARTLRGIMR